MHRENRELFSQGAHSPGVTTRTQNKLRSSRLGKDKGTERNTQKESILPNCRGQEKLPEGLQKKTRMYTCGDKRERYQGRETNRSEFGLALRVPEKK